MIDWIYSINTDNTARYTLGKNGSRVLLCIGINPSTATPVALDPTLKRVESIALNNGYTGWIMLNVYPQRATDPTDIHLTMDNTLHQENINAIRELIANYSSVDVLAAWGTEIGRRPYLMSCLRDIATVLNNNINWLCLDDVTVKGHPRHPLYKAITSELNQFDIQNYLRN